MKKSSLRKETSVEVSRFSMKGSLYIALFTILGTFVFPMLFSTLGGNQKLGIVIGNIIFTASGVVFVRFFIETKKGFSKNMIYQYIFFALFIGIISYFWMYNGIYI